MRRPIGTTCLNLERLEARETPATLVNPTTMTYQDVDGDDVTVRFSKAILAANNVNMIFGFDIGSVNGSNASPQQLRRIDLSMIPAAAGTSVTTTATRSSVHGGDGFANLGELFAFGNDLGAVSIDGDLGRVLAGNGTTTTPGLAALTAQSIGRFGTSTGATNLNSLIVGRLGALTVKSDVVGAWIEVAGGADGDIGPVSIGGSLRGDFNDNSGRIHAAGDIGLVSIKGDIIGGSGQDSGELSCNDKLAGITLGGSLRGGSGKNSGRISASTLGPVLIGGDILGAAGQDSGEIEASDSIASVTVKGSVLGGAGQFSGQITAIQKLGPVTISGDVAGGEGLDSGNVYGGQASSVAVGGSLRGGAGSGGGQIEGGTVGLVRIAGDVIGGSDASSGGVSASTKIASVTISGALLGGSADYAGFIYASTLGTVKIAGRVEGGSGSWSGVVVSTGAISSATIGGSLTGGVGSDAGRVFAGSDIGSVRVGGNIVGAGADSGEISGGGKIGSVFVGGSVKGGTYDHSGRIFANGEITTLTIGHDLVGGSALLNLIDIHQAGFVGAKRIGTMTVGGSVIATPKNNNFVFDSIGSIRVTDDIGSLTIKGNLVGDVTNPVVISAGGAGSNDRAIGTLTILGRVEHANIRGGFDPSGIAVDADARIGTVTVAGDWVASYLQCGLKPAGFNGKDDPTLHSKITSIAFGGQVLGNVGGGGTYFFQSNSIGAFRAGGVTYAMTAGIFNDLFQVGSTGDVWLEEST
jgi:hypothetical protein